MRSGRYILDVYIVDIALHFVFRKCKRSYVMNDWMKSDRIRLEILKEVKIKCAQSYLYRTKGQMDPYSNYIY